MSGQRVNIEGSTPNHGAETRWSPAPPDTKVDVTIYLRRKPGVSAEFDPNKPLSREAAEIALAANPADLDAIHAFAAEYGLRIVEENAGARTVRVEGTVSDMSRAFGVEPGYVEDANGFKHLSYQGSLTIPPDLAGVIVAVLGLDRRSVAKTA